MSEKRFKVGDKVRINPDVVNRLCFWYKDALEEQEKNGGNFTVKELDSMNSCIMKESEYVYCDSWLIPSEKFDIIDYVLNGEENEG